MLVVIFVSVFFTISGLVLLSILKPDISNACTTDTKVSEIQYKPSPKEVNTNVW